MEQKVAQVVNKGMQRDYSMDKASQEFAYENKNIRITSTGNNSFLSITNEKSTEGIINIKSFITYKKKLVYNEDETELVKIIFTLDTPINRDVIVRGIKVHDVLPSFIGEEDEFFTLKKGDSSFEYIVKEEDYKILEYIDGSTEIIKPTNVINLKIVETNESLYDSERELIPTVLGSAVISNYYVIFAKDEDKDVIIRFDFTNPNNIIKTVLYSGDLNFNIENPIECISSYEGEDVQKIYWVDGINQPRYINVAVNEKYDSGEVFNFTPIMTNNLDVEIVRKHDGTGDFTSGIIQYFITYYKKYGAESNLAYVSPLYYVSPKDRGGEPNEKQTCSFHITINNNSDFNGIKVYSMFRSSYNTTPDAKLVYEGELKESITLVIDEGKGSSIDPSDILFLNKNTITASTIEQKDNTLFLGNIKTLNITEEFIEEITPLLKDTLKYEFIYKQLPIKNSTNAYYNYSSNLESPSHILKYFKPREWYRVGIQFKTNTGEWTSVLGVKDIQCNLTIKNILGEQDNLYQDETFLSFLEKEMDVVYVPMLECTLKSNDDWEKIFNKYNIIEWRTVMAEHNDSTRTVKAQGLLLPTIFNISEKFKDVCAYTPLWNMGLTQKAKHFENIETLKETDIEDDVKHWYASYLNNVDSVIDRNAYSNTKRLLKTVLEGKTLIEGPDSGYYLYSLCANIIGDRALSIITQDSVKIKLGITVGDASDSTSDNPTLTYNNLDDIVWTHNAFGQGKTTCREAVAKARTLRWSDIQNKKIYCGYDSETGDLKCVGTIKDLQGINLNDYIFADGDLPSEEEVIEKFTPFSYGEQVHISNGERFRKIVYDANSELIDEHQNEYFFNANICNFLSPDIHNVEKGMNFRIVGGTNINNSISDYYINTESNTDNSGKIVKEAIYNVNFFKKEGSYTGITSLPLWPYDNKMFWVNYWNHSGALSAIKQDNEVIGMFELQSKKFANMWYCNDNTYLTEELDYPVSAIDFISNEQDVFQNNVYKKKYENLILPTPEEHSLYYIDNTSATTPIHKLVEYSTDVLKVDSNVVKSISIKSDSINQCILNLGNIDTIQYILPGYRSVLDDKDVNGIIGETGIRVGEDLGVSFYNTCNINDISIISGFENKTVKEVLEALSLSTNVTDCLIYGDSKEAETITWALKFEVVEDLELVTIGGELSLPSTQYTYMTGAGVNTISVSGASNFISDLSYIKYNPHTGIIRINDNNSFFNVSLYTWIWQTSPLLIGRGLYPPKYLSVSNQKSLRFNYWSDSIVVDGNNQGVIYKGISVQPSTDLNSKLWIGEFYVNYNKESFMGGENYTLNTFIPIYGKYSIPTSTIDGVGYGFEGDTYYQRWDQLRIFPISEEDVNQPVDAFSIMVETHKNLDGDTRSLRGRTDTVNLTENNTNDVLNEVYSQPNNYLTYNVQDERFNNTEYPTMFVWSLTKQALSTIDTWTQINLVNAEKLDEVRGNLNKIKTWNNKLIAFQDKAIALINFNNQTTISTDEGVPVHIANSGKVQGHYYLSTTQGCKNKWSIVSSPTGVYFIDSYNKSINLLNDGIVSLSTLHLFQDWINDNEKGVIWSPINTKGFKSFYDPIRKDVYFVNSDYCLNYNELLSQFVSFYDYQNMCSLECIDGHLYGINGNTIYKMFEGKDYCNLFGNQQDYYIQYKINHDPFIDKTWTNIEYRADVFERGKITSNDSLKITNETFDTLKVWNEYQSGIENLTKAKNKFRIWRANIPRDNKNNKFGLDRIRNPWIMLELSKTSNTDKRMEFHDLLIKYLA